VDRYAEPLGDLGQFWRDDELVGVVSGVGAHARVAPQDRRAAARHTTHRGRAGTGARRNRPAGLELHDVVLMHVSRLPNELLA
jgi:hypothetical protein